MKRKRLLQLVTISILFFTLGPLGTNSKAHASEKDSMNHCSSITLENAAAILAVSADDLQKSSSDLMVSPDDLEKKIYKIQPYSCTIRSKSNFLKFITYVTYVYSDSGQARIEFNKMQKGFASISKVDVVSDIGDEAFWAGDNRFQRMAAIKGNVVIDILSPKDFELKKRIIRLVLDKF
ncbi:MAG: hypothetical protein K9K37_13050 [Desulfocapsa sp.]|nr:hypothetical protein [Desulfocapsa sp.]